MTKTSRRGFLGAAVLAGAPFASAQSGNRAAKEDTQGAHEVTRTLARYLVAARPSDVPANVRKEAARTLLNWVGCAVGGGRHETVDIAIAALAPFSGRAEATVLGRAERLDIFQAALMNGISSHIFDFDDTHLKTIIHPAGPVASAILALSEHQAMSGEDFLNALILGAEVECRIGNAVYPQHYDVGWHITGTVGPFGAAAAAGKLLKLSGTADGLGAWSCRYAARRSTRDVRQYDEELASGPQRRRTPELTGRKSPETGLESKFSVYHAVAAALARGYVGEREFSDAAVQDPAIVGLRGRVNAEVDPAIAEDQVRIVIVLKDGRRFEKRIEHVVGRSKNPMTDAQLEAKFTTLAEGILPASRVRRLMDLCWNVATLPRAAEVARAAAA